MRKVRFYFLSLVVLVAFASCRSIALFDQYAYVEATSIKVDALHLIDHSVEPYSENSKEIDALNLKIEKIFEYEKHRTNNETSAQLWSLLKNPDKNLLGGYLKKWQSDGKLNKAFSQEAKVQISEAFDIIIELESKKIKPSDDVVVNFLNKQK